jgi:CRP/FNR family transcriptional regulator, cyclic AMP receptor protein
MISAELIRRFPFFAGLDLEQINKLAKLGTEKIVEEGHYFFHEDDELDTFYLNLEGAVGIVYEVPERDVEHKVADQFARKLKTKDIVISTVGPGEMFGWPGLVPPHKARSSSKALTPCRVIAFEGDKLLKEFDKDCGFGYVMTQKAAQVIGNRLRDLRVESLAFA